MRIANVGGRATLVVPGGDDRGVDIANASGGKFGPDPQGLYDEWDAFTDFVADLDLSTATIAMFDRTDLRSPVPSPRQVFAIGVNYRAHAAETGADLPEVPATFTKFPASITGPFADVELPNGTVDWEVELVAVIGRRADRVGVADAWSHIAGLTVGQDLSDRHLQLAAGGQFSLGKSHRGFAPIGPWVVTPDEFDDPDDLELGCSIDGEAMQDARTSDLVFGVSQLVAELSAVVPLLPGDIIFTGTPGGVGVSRKPPRFLQPGETLESWIEGIGTIRTRFVSPAGGRNVG
ncbi:MAG: 2,4-didehydro-3-deoxy-L-rhamnonate hydrolase [Actinomycetota bacterium]|jgi:2-keto-4-pentenoate hydratase/2-oxohepta-3-ene-1,7-dioic acid hydratase in catechol pathway